MYIMVYILILYIYIQLFQRRTSDRMMFVAVPPGSDAMTSDASDVGCIQ